jgi:hypothetical protein
MFRIQIGSSVMGKYAWASLEFLLLFLLLILTIFFGSKKKTMESVRVDTGSQTLLQMVRRTKLQLYTVYRVRLPVCISPKSKL